MTHLFHVYHLCALLILLLIASNVWVYVRVLRPLRRLSAQAERLSVGDFAALQCPCGGINEVDILRRAMHGMVGHIRRAQQQRHEYSHALTEGQEAERARLAHELHDDTVQAFIGIAQGVDLALHWLDPGQAQTAVMLRAVRGQAVEAVENLRRVIADLRPPALHELGLLPALRMLAAPGVRVQVAAHGLERRLPEAQELALLRIAQEALRNAVRHGHASTVWLDVTYAPGGVTLVIEDNGVGFVVPADPEHFAADGHYGLLGMTERAAHVHGALHITSTPGRGTSVRVDVPTDRLAPVPLDSTDRTVRDPVCSAVLLPEQAYGRVMFAGEPYYFCCPVCQGAFQQNPQAYLASSELLATVNDATDYG